MNAQVACKGFRFVASYQGEMEYVSLEDGQSYLVRYAAFDKSSAVNKAEERAQVGTVRAKHWPGMESFPPESVLAGFIGYGGARYLSGQGYQYTEPPRTVEGHGALWVRVVYVSNYGQPEGGEP